MHLNNIRGVVKEWCRWWIRPAWHVRPIHRVFHLRRCILKQRQLLTSKEKVEQMSWREDSHFLIQSQFLDASVLTQQTEEMLFDHAVVEDEDRITLSTGSSV